MDKLRELKKRIASDPFFSSPFYLKYHNFIVPGIVSVVALLITALITVPQLTKLYETFKQIEELNQKKDFLQKKVSTLSGIDLDLYRKNLNTALTALPVDRDIPGVTGELLVALSASGMSLEGITFSSAPSSEVGEVSEYALRMDVSGSETDLNNFLGRVKLLPRIIKLSSIEVTKGRGTPLSASINFVTLYQNLPDHIGVADEEVPVLTASENQILDTIDNKAKAVPQTTIPAGPQTVDGKLNPFAP